MKEYVKLYEGYKSQTLDSKAEISKWLDSYYIKDYEITDELVVNVKGDVHLYNVSISVDSTVVSELPVQFGKVAGSFQLIACRLTSTKGFPEYVESDFNVNSNNLKSLEGCPTSVGGGHFNYGWNRLTSLVFSPKEDVIHFGNPCSKIYQRLGFTTEAHVEALKTLDSDWKGTLEKLKLVYPQRYKEISLDMGLSDDEDLQKAYNNSKSREGDFY